jgi:hypothetical protein
MSRVIDDQFTHLPVTSQRKWQLRRHAEGKCIICARPQVMQFFCLKHAVGKRELERAANGFKTRRTSFRSYRAEAMEAAR